MDEPSVRKERIQINSRSARARSLLVNTSIAIISFCGAFTFGEIIVRVLYREQAVLFPRYHTDYQYGEYVLRGVRPNSDYWMTSVDGSWNFITNNRGFRNKKNFSYSKPQNTLRVLSLGDSHTQGYEVRQDFTFSAVLERFLALNVGPAEVINAGVSGFSTAEELVLLENEGAKYLPDVVILGFFANDFEDNLKSNLFGIDMDGQLTYKNYKHIPGVRIQNAIYSLPPVRWLSEHSYFYSLLFNRVWDFFKARLAESAVRNASVGGASIAAVSNAPEYAVPTEASTSPLQITLAAKLIERMHEFCKSRGIRFIVVDIPTSVGRYRYASSMPPALVEHLAASKIEVIESKQVLAGTDGVAEIHVPHGHRHISEFTHSLIGIEIGRRLAMPGAAKKSQ